MRHSQRIATLFRSLYDFPKTTIAAVNGAAIAGGAGLATLCDFTLASTAASFGYTEVRIGFVPAMVSAFLLRQVGEKHARDLLLTGRIITAEEAYRMGLVNEVVEAGASAGGSAAAGGTVAGEFAGLAAGDQGSAAGLWQEIVWSSDIQSGMEANASMRMSADFKEGVRSFLERRKPQWRRMKRRTPDTSAER